MPEETNVFSDIQEIYSSRSGYNRLYRCQRYGKTHILKALLPQYMGTAFYEQALKKEFNIGFQLEHPHICRTLGWEQIPSLGHCILLEYVNGITLREFLDQGKLTQPLAAKFIREMCSALQYLHSKQIIHRDLKPDNILITHNGNNIKLIDFSLSDCDDYSILKLPAGTRYYIAPEALRTDVTLDLRADIYSLGMIIAEMATLLKDKHLAAVSRKCTQQKREKRYASAFDVANAVAHSHRRTYRAVAAAAMVAVVAASFFFLTQQKKEIPLSDTSYPVYGNQVINTHCRHLLEVTCRKLLNNADSLTDKQSWNADSLKLMTELKQMFDKEYPLPDLQQTAAYRNRWQSLQQEANRRLTETYQLISIAKNR